MAQKTFNPCLSVDCVVFGFDGTTMKVLLVERKGTSEPKTQRLYKLPGSLIFQDEDMPSAANRVLSEMTNLHDVYLKLFAVFSDPNRIDEHELLWLNSYYGVATERVVSAAYYSLIRIDSKINIQTKYRRAVWCDIHKINTLALDHKQIITDAINALTKEISQLPIALKLLPNRFTIRQLQTLYEAFFGIEIDNRNFRKKLLDTNYLIPTGEKETGVAHKPAEYYRFDSISYNREKRKPLINFI